MDFIHVAKSAGFHLLEPPLFADQPVKELADQFDISATVMDTGQLQWLLRWFEDQVSDV